MNKPESIVEITAKDLLGPNSVACPNPKMTAWSGHPRVFIALGEDGQGSCPYCGTVYRLKHGEKLAGHH